MTPGEFYQTGIVTLGKYPIRITLNFNVMPYELTLQYWERAIVRWSVCSASAQKITDIGLSGLLSGKCPVFSPGAMKEVL